MICNIMGTLYPCRDEKGLGCSQEMTVAAKYSYFSTLKNVSRTWFRRPIRDWIFRVLGLICPCLDGRILPAEELLSCCDASALFEKTNKQHSSKHTGRLSRLCLTKAASAQGRWLCNQTPGNAFEWRVHFPTLLVLPFISDRRHDP